MSRDGEKLRAVFGSSQGREALAILRAEFKDRELRGEDALDMAYRVGQHDVIRWIEDVTGVRDE